MSQPVSFDPSTAIAVIGLEGRFPGADDIDQFWQLLRDGREGLERLDDQQLLDAGVEPAALEREGFVKVGASIDRAEHFDAELFGYSPREAEIIDPQQRIFLECSYRALENAGYDPSTYGGLIGVYGAIAQSRYIFNLISRPDKMAVIDRLSMRIGNENDYVTNRVGYKLDLRGPCVNVQSACSSGLVAVHVAVGALLNGETDLALAGAVCGTGVTGYDFRDGGVHSPDGRCRTFDAAAEGTVFTCGAGLAVLKRYEDARDDGDHIRAIILGSAVNNDGEQKVGYTAPGVEGQRRVILEALEVAEIDPSTIGYVEAHGTATPLGDPIEISALTQAWRKHTDEVGYCAIGSVKSNVGHADAAAGIVGFIKTVLALENRQLPPSLHFDKPNPQIDFANSPFVVNTELCDWRPVGASPRRAAVSSFGMGGTNAHLILQEAPQVDAAAEPSRGPQLLVFSAHTESALAHATERLADDLEARSDAALGDVAWTLQAGRKAHRYRRALVATERSAAVSALRSGDAKLLRPRLVEKVRPVVFMFPGQGAQHVGMAAELYRDETTFRAELDRCSAALEPHLGQALTSLLYPAESDREAATERLAETAVTQPALFAIEYALARQWAEWGVEPQAMIGHSIGEYVAACLAGVFDLDAALGLVACRGRLMQELPRGAMLAVPLPAAELEPLLDGGLALAAANTSRRSVVSGPEAEVEAFAKRLNEEQGVAGRPLHTSHAFHSSMMDPILESFAAELRKADLKAPEIPFVSNLTGTWIRPEEATDPTYWTRHLRQAVRFSDGLATLFEEPGRVLLEVGPGRTLSTLARQHSNKPAELVVVPSLPHPRDQPREQGADMAHVVEALGQLWTAGARVSWQGFHRHEKPGRVPLPGYALEGQRYFIEAGDGNAAALSGLDRKSLADWFHTPIWKPSVAPLAPALEDSGPWVVLGDREGLAPAICERLRGAGCEVFALYPAAAGDGFASLGDNSFQVRANHREDFGHALVAIVGAAGTAPRRILHLWGLGGAPEEFEARGFWSLLYLAQAMAGKLPAEGLSVQVASRGLAAVAPSDQLEPLRATTLGPCRVLPKEMPGLEIAVMDLESAEQSPDLILAEALAPAIDALVAYRAGRRYVEQLESLPLDQIDESRLPLRHHGVYLITGGLGGLGLAFAEDLAQRFEARLALLSRSELPPREGWSRFLQEAVPGDPVAERLRAVGRLEEAGAKVLTLAADVTDAEQMGTAIARIEERFGKLDGAIHAAGVPAGGLAQLKTAEAARRVLAPKVAGTLVLEQALGDRQLDFLVLTSSTLGRLAPLGQVDYAAANCFLDAFAQGHASSAKSNIGQVVSIAWDAWSEVGMAVSSAAMDSGSAATTAAPESSKPVTETTSQSAAAGQSSSGPDLVLRALSTVGTQSAYAFGLEAGKHWLVAEHLVAGYQTLPGTAYLELARQVFRHHVGDGALEVRELYFLAPLMLADGEVRQVELIVDESAGGGWQLMIASAQPPMGGGEPVRTEHARCQLDLLTAAPPSGLGPAALGERLERRLEVGNGLNIDSSFVSWGPRWQSLHEMKASTEEALASLRLAEEFGADLDHWRLHPALLDVATGIGAGLLAQGMYLPLSYRRVQVWGDLPAELYSHLRWQGELDDESRETLSFDLSLLDRQGDRLMEIEGFTLKRVRQATSRALATDTSAAAKSAAAEPAAAALAVAQGIRAAEGVEALYRILSRCHLPQVMVSVRDPLVLMAQLAAYAAEARGPASASHARPDLETGFVEPRTDTERRVAEIWQEQLGIAEVGVDDNFFDLGGDSVVGIQLVARLGEIGFEVAAEHLFEHQTVAELAAYLDGAETADSEQAADDGSDFDDGGLGDEDLAKVLARLEGLT